MFNTLFEHAYQLIIVLFLLSMLPLLLVIGSSFLKLALTLSLLRNALGIQQIPPNIAIYGLSLLLTLFIMAPIGFTIYEKLEPHIAANTSITNLTTAQVEEILQPYRSFLQRNTAQEQISFFEKIVKQHWPEKYHDKIAKPGSLVILMPAFTLTQLIEAFKIGLLLYLPFIAIDLIVSNILLAMGMMMVSPITISLPFKLLIFILVGGWQMIMGQLIASYL